MLPPAQIVIAASNFPGAIDEALYRRFSSRIAFAPPGLEARTKMLEYWWRHLPMGVPGTDNILALAKSSEGVSGATLRALAMTEARAFLLSHEGAR